MSSKVLIGVLVDVSGSMELCLKLDVDPNEEQITRIKSIFKTIINIAKQEGNRYDSNELFVLAFGLKNVPTCDLLALFNKIQNTYTPSQVGYAPLIKLLADNSAPHAEKYIKKYMTENEAGFLYNFYSENIYDLKVLIKELPDVCKAGASSTVKRGGVYAAKAGESAASFIFSIFLPINIKFNNIDDKEKEITRKQAEKAINNAKIKIQDKWTRDLEAIAKPQQIKLKEAINLLNEVGNIHISPIECNDQLTNLVNLIEPYIYGDTPMCKAIEYSFELFQYHKVINKYLFILTDGEATDDDPAKFISQIKEHNLVVLVCLLTSDNIPCPRRLYYEKGNNWTEIQQKMFDLSTSVDNSNSAMSFLIKQNWQLPTEGRSRLFIQANHPHVINEFSSLVRHMANSNDAILNIYAQVKLDIYINSSITKFEAKKQKKSTCYAYAVATVLHLALMRREGPNGTVPKFRNLRKKLIKQFGTKGASTQKVLDTWLRKYLLHYKSVDELGARKAINERRPVIAIFDLDDPQWDDFENFYKQNPKGIIAKNDLSPLSGEEFGHSVVLMKCKPDCLKFMNSWGKEFADNGFFKVKDQSVLNLEFFDVYWNASEFQDEKRNAFKCMKDEVGGDILRIVPDSIKILPYKCPLCHKSSPAQSYAGYLLEAICPMCKETFIPTALGFVWSW